MRERVSVIIPVYNRAHIVRRSLDSVAAQSWRPLEIVAIDNDSSDETRRVIELWKKEREEKYPDDSELSIIISDESKKGASAARNKGFRISTGQFAGFFDSDDIMRPGLIESAMEVFHNNCDADIVCWRCAIHLLDGKVRIPPFNAGKPIENHLIHSLLRTQGYIAKRGRIEKTGGWNEELPGWNDLEMGMRLLLAGSKVKALEGVWVDIISGEDSITGRDFTSKEGIWEKSLEAIRDAAEKSPHPEKERILNIITYRKIILASHYRREGNREGAEKILKETLPSLPLMKRMLMKLTYHYTRRGGHGAWKLAGRFL